MSSEGYTIRRAKESEFEEIGELMVKVYSSLDGFPKESDQPDYYRMLRCVGDLLNKPEVELFIAVDSKNRIIGAVVFFGDMKYYGSGGTAANETNSAGFRLLAVHPDFQGIGVGKRLAKQCISTAIVYYRDQVIIHTTMAMQRAWKMYENLGFIRSEKLDFIQGELPVFGFRLRITYDSWCEL